MPQESQEYRQIEQDYRRKVAIVTWREVVARVAVGVVIALETLGIVFFLWNCGWYVVQTSFSDRAAATSVWQNFPLLAKYEHAQAPQPLVLGDATAVPTADGADVFATLQNTNADHYAHFTYSFSSDAGETEQVSGFINPGETKYVAVFGLTSKHPLNVRLHVSDVLWTQVDTHVVPHAETWIADRLNFPVSNVVYHAEPHLNATVSFSLENVTTFSYWEPAFTVLLMRGTTTIGIARVTVPQFMQHETRSVTTQWFGDYPSTVTVKVVPEIEVFDEAVYK